MAIKTRRKISYYKVARLIVILFIMVGAIYHHEYLFEVLTTPEPQHKSADEMSADYRARFQEEADRKLHEKLAEEAKQKSITEQETWFKAQQEAEKARSEKERANFIEHRRDPHWPVVAQ